MRLPDRMRAFHAATRGVLLWEMAWRALLPLICVLGLFLALALLALPALLPPWVHAAYLALFALLLLGALWFAVGHWRLPDHHRVLRRLETDSALSHRPLGALEDRLTNAHDALADVMATIAMARLVRERQPKLYRYVYESRLKHRVAPLVDPAARKPFLHVSGRLPRENGYTALMIPLCQHPGNKNAVIAFNLMADPAPLLNLDAEAVRERVFSRTDELAAGEERIALKAIHINRCPVVATPKLLDDTAARRLAIDLDRCERHWRQLRDADLGAKLARVFDTPDTEARRDADLALYGGFLPDVDKPLLAAVRNASAVELASHSFPFTDARYRELLLRYKGRHFPQALGEEEVHQWEELRDQQLNEPAPGRLTLEEYFAELDQLEETRVSPRDRDIIAALRDWGDTLVAL